MNVDRLGRSIHYININQNILDRVRLIALENELLIGINTDKYGRSIIIYKLSNILVKVTSWALPILSLPTIIIIKLGLSDRTKVLIFCNTLFWILINWRQVLLVIYLVLLLIVSHSFLLLIYVDLPQLYNITSIFYIYRNSYSLTLSSIF